MKSRPLHGLLNSPENLRQRRFYLTRVHLSGEVHGARVGKHGG